MKIHGFAGCGTAARSAYRLFAPLMGVPGLVLAGILLGGFGCRRSPRMIPESPPDAVQAVVEGLADHRPRVLWDALPPSYQADIRELIKAFCACMDARIYDQAWDLLAKAVQVMREKEEFLYRSPIALSVPMLESSMGSQWDETVDLLNTIATSDLSSLESLGRMDPGEFLATTGHRIMERLDDLRNGSQRSPGPNPWQRIGRALDEARIDFDMTGDTQGFLRFRSATNNAVKEVELTRVEDRWVPAEMAAAWAARVEQARTNLAKLDGPEFEQAKPMLSLLIGSLDGAMDSLLQAETQQEFDTTLQGLTALGGMVRALQGRP